MAGRLTGPQPRAFGVHQRPAGRGKVFRRVAVTAPAAALLTGMAIPAT
ncbi:hypothetical protein ACNF49_30245 [Actinomadura sp. ATCC 39365]